MLVSLCWVCKCSSHLYESNGSKSCESNFGCLRNRLKNTHARSAPWPCLFGTRCLCTRPRGHAHALRACMRPRGWARPAPCLGSPCLGVPSTYLGACPPRSNHLRQPPSWPPANQHSAHQEREREMSEKERELEGGISREGVNERIISHFPFI